MNIVAKYTVILVIGFLVACGNNPPPTDSNGKTPDQVLLETYKLVVDKKFDEAKKSFSEAFLKEFVTSKNLTFEEYCSNASHWQKSWLTTEMIGNDYNDDVWRARITPDEGKGNQNGPGIVHDFAVIDGEWKIVFWGHYPKS